MASERGSAARRLFPGWAARLRPVLVLSLALAWALVWALVWGPATGAPALAASARAYSDNPEVLQRELDQLRVTYKDNHPDVIRARRALEKALEKRRQAAEAAGRSPAAPGQAGAPAGDQAR